MATYIVTTTNDEDGSEGVSTGLSLREAVAAANASGGADTIVFADGLAASEITLTRGQIAVTDALVLDGDNTSDGIADFAISGDANGNNIADAGDSRVFAVSADLTLKNIAIQDGHTEDGSGGGGILLTGGDLSLDNVSMTGNTVTGAGASGGAIKAQGGTVSVEDSSFSGNQSVRAGGAIEVVNGADVEIDDSSFTGNSTLGAPGNGGALHVTGAGSDVVVSDSSFSGNFAAAEGGALWNDAGSTLTVTGSTISGNVADGDALDNGGGGLFNNGGRLSVTATSVLENSATGTSGSGGGILSTGGMVTLDGVTVTDNASSRAGGGIEVIDGSFTITGSALSGNVTGTSGSGTTANPGNGGALHVSGMAGTTVSLINSSVTGNFAAREGGGLWNQAGSTMIIDNSHIGYNEAAGTAADDGGGGLFNNGGTLQVMDSTLEGNTASAGSGSGGGLFSMAGAVSVSNSTILSNDANRAGGGIEIVAGSLSLAYTDFGDNAADGGGNGPGNGGAIHVTGAATTTIQGGYFGTNRAALEGGALWNSATGTMTVAGATIAFNVAGGAAADDGGGGVFNNGGTLSIADTRFQQNLANGAAGSGGAVFSLAGQVNVAYSSFEANQATRAGGAVEMVAGSAAFSDNDFSDNAAGGAPGNGGAVHVGSGMGASASFTGDRFTGNSAANQGGGLWVGTGAMASVAGAIFADNAAGGAGGGGGIYVVDGGDLTVDGSILIGNDALRGDAVAVGGIAASAGHIEVRNSAILDDDIVGSSQADLIEGDSGANLLFGGGGDDTIRAGGGADTLVGGDGLNRLEGGDGNDVYIDPFDSIIVEDADGGRDRVEAGTSVRLVDGVENLTLTGSANVFGVGNAANNTIIGNDGDNVIAGNGSADSLLGSAGHDTLIGGDGTDTLLGGTGNDVYRDVEGDYVIELAGEGIDLIETSASTRLGANVENLTLTGSGHVNGSGNELANTIRGNGGANTIAGNDGDDFLSGGAGDDLLLGGMGRDTLLGGDGVDTFRALIVAESTGASRDTLASFDFNTDKIDLSVRPVGIGAAASGALSEASFDQDLMAALDAGRLGANQAVLFDPTSGDLDTPGTRFLVVDMNGVGGYQAGDDLVFQLSNSVGSLTLDCFV